MPELPEVETVRKGLEPVLTGAAIEKVELRRKDLRVPFPKNFAERLAGRRVLALRRRAKYLVAELDDGEALVMHLGMSGSFRIAHGAEPDSEAPAGVDPQHDHAVFRLRNGKRVIYNDPRRFGLMQLAPGAELDRHPLLAGLGIDPLGEGMTAETLAAAFAKRKSPLKAALLDQKLIAGLGNIYVCEALHRAGLSPLRPANSLVTPRGKAKAELVRLVDAIPKVLREAIEAGGSSLRNHRGADGALGYFQFNFRVYDREGGPCPTPGCGGAIERIVQGGRSTFYCPKCQK